MVGQHAQESTNRNENGTITNNLIIKGNNLLGLYTLKEEFAGKIKLIYMDPPYNTGGEAESFTYNNSFKHSTWYTFIKNRLDISKYLLREDGFIAIAIDHVELFYLGVIADDIFGRENRVGVVSVVHKAEGRNQEKFFGTSNEFMLVYAKNKSIAEFESVILDKNLEELYDTDSEKGNKFRLKNFIRFRDGKYSLRENKPHFYYPIYVSNDLSQFSLEQKHGFSAVYPITDKNIERTWKTTRKTAEKLIREDKLLAQFENGRIDIYEKLQQNQVIKTHWVKKEYHAYHYGTKLLEKLLGRKAFSFPKSLYTVLDTIKLMSSENDIVLDFHAGSGTTAHAILELNNENDIRRQFILIEQLQEHIDIILERTAIVLNQLNSNESISYFELKRYNQTFIQQIEVANDTDALLQIWEQIKAKGFLNYNVDLRKQEKYLEEFKAFSLEEQKQLLCEILDKNQLYVNLSSLNDADFACTEEEKKVTKEFYQLKK